MGSPAVSGVTSRQQVRFHDRIGFFPRGGDLRPADAPDSRALGERRFKLPASTPDRVGIQTGDLCHQLVTTIPETVGFDGGIPPPLLFIQRDSTSSSDDGGA